MICEHCTDDEPCPRHEPQDPTGKLVVANVSGGKDSTALSLWLTEQGIEHRRVFADTGWEHPKTYEYLREYLPGVIGPITWVRAEKQMADLVRHKAIFPSRRRRYCTVELKVKPINAYFDEIDPEFRAISAVGIRAAESKSRSEMAEWEHDGNGFMRWVWRPLINWSLQDIIDIHTRHGVRPNPLYLDSAERVGCWPCIYSRKSEIRLVALRTPERIDEIRKLESEVDVAWREKLANRGEEPRLDQGPTFFQSRHRGGGFMPIDEVVKWSQTSHGGKQVELFQEPEDTGCMRWGLCDHGPDDSGSDE